MAEIARRRPRRRRSDTPDRRRLHGAAGVRPHRVVALTDAGPLIAIIDADAGPLIAIIDADADADAAHAWCLSMPSTR